MRPGESGFTIMEVLVTIVVLSLAAFASGTCFTSTTNLLGDNALQDEAVVLTQGVVEGLRTIPYEEIESGTEESEDGTFLLTTEVTDDYPERGMKMISVTASWKWKGTPQDYELQTIYSRLTKN